MLSLRDNKVTNSSAEVNQVRLWMLNWRLFGKLFQLCGFTFEVFHRRNTTAGSEKHTNRLWLASGLFLLCHNNCREIFFTSPDKKSKVTSQKPNQQVPSGNAVKHSSWKSSWGGFWKGCSPKTTLTKNWSDPEPIQPTTDPTQNHTNPKPIWLGTDPNQNRSDSEPSEQQSHPRLIQPRTIMTLNQYDPELIQTRTDPTRKIRPRIYLNWKSFWPKTDCKPELFGQRTGSDPSQILVRLLWISVVATLPLMFPTVLHAAGLIPPIW